MIDAHGIAIKAYVAMAAVAGAITALGAHRLLDRHPLRQSVHQRLANLSRAARDFGYRQHLALPFVDLAIAPIARLFRRARPTAILRFVIAVTVDAVKRSPVWPWPHVRKERSKGIAPGGVHRYASAAIVGELRISRVVASVFGIQPSSVFGRRSYAGAASHPRRVPVLCHLGGGNLPAKTAAAFAAAAAQGIEVDEARRSTLAAHPHELGSSTRFRLMSGDPSPKSLTHYRHAYLPSKWQNLRQAERACA